MILIQNVTRRFGDRTILDGATLNLEENRIHALIAPNGTGKTTLLSIIADILSPDAGRVIDTRSGRKPNTTLLLSGANNLFMKNTVKENLLYLAAMHGMPLREARDILKTIARFFPVVSDVVDRPAEMLSYGQKRMIAIVSAAMSNSTCLIVDEAAEGLDVDNVHALTDLLHFIARSQTVIIASHDLRFCFETADSFHFLSRGTVATIERPTCCEELVRQYQLLYSAGSGAEYE